MALEYVFYGAADVATDDLRVIVQSVLDGSTAADGTIRREGLSSFAYRVEPGEEAAAPSYFGFTHRLTVGFRFTNNMMDLHEHNTALMVGVVLAINDRTGTAGVLLLNGEEAVILCRNGEVTFAADWEDWDDNPEVVALKSERLVAAVEQPLL